MGKINYLRSYKKHDEQGIDASICEAAKATTAAPAFFDPVEIKGRSFADAGLGANNPVNEVEREASDIWSPEERELKPMVKCFISIGTGNPGPNPFQNSMYKFLTETLVRIATDTETTAENFMARWAKHSQGGRYFRFNVEQGLQGIGLEEYERKGDIEEATLSYLRDQKQKIALRDCIKNLSFKESVYIENFA